MPTLAVPEPLGRIARTLVRTGAIPKSLWFHMQPLGAFEVDVAGCEPFTYIADRRDQHARRIVWDNLRSWEETTIPLWVEAAKGAGVVLDVGAYSGIYTLLACAADSDLRVVAVEPQPLSRSFLDRNVTENNIAGRVSVLGCAAGRERGRANISIPEGHGLTSSSLLAAGNGTDVNVLPLDEVVGDADVGLAKIDVEHFEVEVLDGLQRTIRRCRPTLFIEVLDSETFVEVYERLAGVGYEASHIGPGGAVTTTHFRSVADYPNYVFRPSTAG